MVFFYFLFVAGAMKALFAKGIVHRDLKPQVSFSVLCILQCEPQLVPTVGLPFKIFFVRTCMLCSEIENHPNHRPQTTISYLGKGFRLSINSLSSIFFTAEYFIATQLREIVTGTIENNTENSRFWLCAIPARWKYGGYPVWLSYVYGKWDTFVVLIKY